MNVEYAVDDSIRFMGRVVDKTTKMLAEKLRCASVISGASVPGCQRRRRRQRLSVCFAGRRGKEEKRSEPVGLSRVGAGGVSELRNDMRMRFSYTARRGADLPRWGHWGCLSAFSDARRAALGLRVIAMRYNQSLRFMRPRKSPPSKLTLVAAWLGQLQASIHLMMHGEREGFQ